MAKKEIQNLYGRLQKKAKKNEEKEIQDKQISNFNIEHNEDLNVAGLLKLKIFKRELTVFYKALINVVMAEEINKKEALALEKKANQLIMSVDDAINEVEILNFSKKS